MRAYRWITVSSAGLLLLLLAGCGSVQLREAPPDRSLVFAYFDFSVNEMELQWGRIKQVSPLIEKPFFPLGYLRGVDGTNDYGTLVWQEGLGNGSYQITSLGGRQTLFLRRAILTLRLGEMGKNETAVRIDKPGIYFLGAYKYKPDRSTWADAVPWTPEGRFEMEKIDAPSEATLLKALLKISKGTGWEARLQERLRMVGY